MATGTPDEIGQTLGNGRYLIRAKLGEGGMGTVYRARDRNIDADVVIKVPLRAMFSNPQFSHHFKEEIRSLVKLSHPHIVKLSDVGDWNGLPFAVMQFLPGGSLEDRRPAGPQGTRGMGDPRDVRLWLDDIANALDYVHSRNYVHGDVKPGNILFDAQGHAFLGDFGVARALASASYPRAGGARGDITEAGRIVGTAEYVAPELIVGGTFDGRADQYALAVTVYEILSGQRPFEHEHKGHVLGLQVDELPSHLSILTSWIPTWVSDVVLKGLAKDPNNRYDSCSEFASAVGFAISKAFANQPERIRFKCPACARSLGLAVADYNEFRKSGQTVSCPACKTAFHLPPDNLARANAASPVSELGQNGTMIEPQLGPAGDIFQASGRRVTSVEALIPIPPKVDLVDRDQHTMIEPLNSQRLAATSLEQPILGRRATTPIEGPGRKDASRPVFGLEQEQNASQTDAETVAPTAKTRRKIPPIPWIITGLSTATTCVVLALTVGPFASHAKKSASHVAPTKQANSLVAKVERVSSVGLPRPDHMTRFIPSVAPREVRGLPSVSENPPLPKKEPAFLNLIDDYLQISTEIESNLVPSPEAAPARTQFKEAQKHRAEILARRPRAQNFANKSKIADNSRLLTTPYEKLSVLKESVAIERLLADPSEYANQAFTLKQTYCIAKSFTRDIHDSFRLPIIEGCLVFQGAPVGSVISTLRRNQFELEIDPDLAENLKQRNLVMELVGPSSTEQAWSDEVAILTIGVVSEKGPRRTRWIPTIIKCEFLLRVIPRTTTIANKQHHTLFYRTMTVTPRSVSYQGGNPDDWAQVDRILHLVHQYKAFYGSKHRHQNHVDWSRFDKEFSRMIRQSFH